MISHTLGVHGDGPMHQVQVNIIDAQALQADLQVLLDARVEGAPKLRGDEDILSLDPRIEGLLQASSDLILVTIAVGGVDVLVSILECVRDGVLDFSGGGLPCS